jgi:hypothetical protein
MIRSTLQLLFLSLLTGAVLTLLIYIPLLFTCAGVTLCASASLWFKLRTQNSEFRIGAKRPASLWIKFRTQNSELRIGAKRP